MLYCIEGKKIFLSSFKSSCVVCNLGSRKFNQIFFFFFVHSWCMWQTVNSDGWLELCSKRMASRRQQQRGALQSRPLCWLVPCRGSFMAASRVLRQSPSQHIFPLSTTKGVAEVWASGGEPSGPDGATAASPELLGETRWLRCRPRVTPATCCWDVFFAAHSWCRSKFSDALVSLQIRYNYKPLFHPNLGDDTVAAVKKVTIR